MSTPVERLTAALADRYRTERELGAGGMATVYLAHDLRHDRRVALKVLRPELAAVIGADRFLTEIRTTAALSHPHILPLHDSGAADGFLFYVMPFVEGESLRDRLNRDKQLPIAAAIQVASDVAGALDYAHRHGVIHRDIKPENILLHDGRAMVADFGIALAASKASGPRMTETGMSLGIPHYMSPEQAMGERELGGRSDVYALGAVTYEMLTGEPPFTGPTAQAIVAKVMTSRPEPVATLRPTVPAGLEVAVMTALERLPADRFESAAAFATALAAQGIRPIAVGATGAGSRAFGRLGLRPVSPGWVGVAIMAFFAGAIGVQLMSSADAPGELAYFTFDVPAQQLPRGISSRFALSPDGRSLVYAGADDRLYVKRMDSPDVMAIPASEGAVAPSFSPDGQWLVYSQAGAVKKHAIRGGSTVTLVQQPSNVGTSWSRDGASILLVSLTSEAVLRRVSAEGGEIQRITSASDTAPAINHVWPQALPGGDAVLFTAIGPSGRAADSRIVLLDLRTGESHVVVSRAMHGRYLQSGGSEYLLYALADGTVLAAPFNLRRRQVTGPAFAAVSDVQVAVGNGAALYEVADNGTLAFVRGNSTNLQLVKWVDRTGRELGTIGPPLTATGAAPYLTVSPDGRRIALTIRTPANNNLWLMTTASGQLDRLTFGPTEDESPVWSPDGRSVAYASTREGGVTWVYTKSVAGLSDTTRIYAGRSHGHLSSWSPDGRWLLFESPLGDILALRSDGQESLTVAADSGVVEASGQFSPDGRWIAFASDQTGRPEVYLISFPQLTGKRQVSIEGGTNPRWARDGRTLFYQQGRRLLAVPVSLRPALSLGTARMLFEADFLSFEVAPDGQRFLLLTPNPEANRAEIHVVLNWSRELKEREKAARR